MPVRQGPFLMKEFRFPLAAPIRSESFRNERANHANDPPVRPQFWLGRHDGIPSGPRWTEDPRRATTATCQGSIAQQRRRKRLLPGLRDLVVLARRTDLSLRHATVFPP